MNGEWWLFQVILPLAPFWLVLLVLLVIRQWDKSPQTYRDGSIWFYVFSLAAYTIFEYQKAKRTPDKYYFIELVSGFLVSGAFYGLAIGVNYLNLADYEKENAKKRIGLASLWLAAFVILISFLSKAGRQ